MVFFKNNPWVGYAERDYLVMKQQILTRTQNPITGIPEITDHNDSNPFVKRISIWCGIAEQLGYYIDNKGREAFLMTARLYRSLVNKALEFDYRVRGAIPATGEVEFYVDNPLSTPYSIPVGTVVKTIDGIEYETLSTVTIAAGSTSAIANVRQWTKVPQYIVGTSNGQPSQKITLTEDVADNSVSLLVGSTVAYSPIDSFVLASHTSTVFMGHMNVDGSFEILFGDGVNGIIPPASSQIEISYYTTRGAEGNVNSNTVKEFVTTMPPLPTLKVRNNAPMVGGTDSEGIYELKKNIPLSLRTLYRAVSDQDYIDVTELAPGVGRAGLSYSCGKYVDIYIAPNGGGIASPTLLNDTFNFLDLRKIITTFIRMNAAGQVVIEYEIMVKALPNFYNNDVKNNVIQTLVDFHDITNQKISGSVAIGDIYQHVENTSGVDNSEILLMRAMPYARPLLPSYPVLNWVRQQKPTSLNATYKVSFVSSTQFKVQRNNVYLGTFNVGQQVSTIDLDFTINAGTYVIGNIYEFKTYQTSGTINLSEPSLPTFDISRAVINVTGGLV